MSCGSSELTFPAPDVRRLSLSEPTSEISLNTAAPLVLLGAVLVPAANASRRLAPVEVRHEEDKQLSTLIFGEPVPAGEATVGLRWEGSLQEETMLGQLRWLSTLG